MTEQFPDLVKRCALSKQTVASVWRKRWAPLRAESMPARISARLTIVETVMESPKPRRGARCRRNT